jgi:putative ABC transport system permease protein
MSLVGILTAIDALLQSISNNFNRLGANSFNVERIDERINTKTQGRRRRTGEAIVYSDAKNFKDRFEYGGAEVSMELYAGGGKTVEYREEETNPNIRLTGIDEEYLEVSAFELEVGRPFSRHDIENATPYIIVGMGIVNKLFDGKVRKALDKKVLVDGTRYKIIGVTKSKGSTFGDSNDRRVFVPITKARLLYASSRSNYNITVAVANQLDLEDAISRAVGIMRGIRGLRPVEENDFQIQRSSSVMSTIKDLTKTLRLATVAIGFMTLVGAAIGLMNIMLVTVTERTKEIGVTKALGATRRSILIQFLTEAVAITMIGGILGIIFGVIIGNVVSYVVGETFIFPVLWVLLGLIVCFVTGVLSGLYPALKASALDPIEALRYE